MDTTQKCYSETATNIMFNSMLNKQNCDANVERSNAYMAVDKNGNEIAVKKAVKLSSDAVYYGGAQIPAWVKNDSWIVLSVKGDRVVLGENASGSNRIDSPVYAHQIIVQGAVSGKPSVAERGMDFSISERGVELIAKYEGCQLKAYRCPAGVWTIGFGHTEGVKEGQTLSSKEEAKRLLRKDLIKYSAAVNACVKSGKITFPLNQNMFDALTSFCYNCGSGNLSKLVSGRNRNQVADTMLLYNKGGGKVLAGLVKRREEERRLFLS